MIMMNTFVVVTVVTAAAVVNLMTLHRPAMFLCQV